MKRAWRPVRSTTQARWEGESLHARALPNASDVIHTSARQDHMVLHGYGLGSVPRMMGRVFNLAAPQVARPELFSFPSHQPLLGNCGAEGPYGPLPRYPLQRDRR